MSDLVNSFEAAERILIPKGRDKNIVLNWIEEQGFEPPTPPTEDWRCLHLSCWQ